MTKKTSRQHQEPSTSTSTSTSLAPGLRLADATRASFALVRKLGSGSFGELWLATNLRSGSLVALKLEPGRSRFPQLVYESRVYREIAGGLGIPRASAAFSSCGYQSSTSLLLTRLLLLLLPL